MSQYGQFQNGTILDIRDRWYVTSATYNSYKTYLSVGRTLTVGNTKFTVTSAPAQKSGSMTAYVYATSGSPAQMTVPSGRWEFTMSPNHSYTYVSSNAPTGGALFVVKTGLNGTSTSVSDSINNAWGINLMVYSDWHLRIIGFWYGSIAMERWSTEERRWVVMDTYSSPQTTTATAVQNFDVSGTVQEPTDIRVRAVTGFTQFLPTTSNVDADRGYVELSRAQSVHTGTFRITSVTNATTAAATVVTRLANSALCFNWQQGAWSNYEGWPSAVGFFEERLVFASTNKEPQTIWMSRTGDYYDFGTHLPIVDDDAITRTLAARQLNKIEAIVPTSDLIIMTSSNEWKVSGGASGGLTPTNFTARVQGARGCNKMEPEIVNATVIFAQSKGRRICDLLYSYETDLYQGQDLTILAPHIFELSPAKDWAFQGEPDSTLWIIRQDGVLVSLTYLREQDVVAWARHPMDGNAKAISCLTSRETDTVYIVMDRNGVYSVETMVLAHETTPAQCYYLDGGVKVDSYTNNISSVDGLWHLEGTMVDMLVDGDVVNHQRLVKEGTVSLSAPARTVSVGIPYEARVETLDFGFDRKDGSQLTAKARIAEMKIRVQDTRGLFVATQDNDDYYTEIKDRTREGQGSPIQLFTGDYDVGVLSGFDGGRIIIKAPHPLPARILSIVPSIELAGR